MNSCKRMWSENLAEFLCFAMPAELWHRGSWPLAHDEGSDCLPTSSKERTMRLVTRDLVRERPDMTLGTVARAITVANASTLAVHGGTTRPADPVDTELARGDGVPATPLQSGVVLIFIVLGLVVAVINGVAVHQLGGGLPTALIDTCTTAISVSGVLINIYSRPRRRHP